jgi:LmbE family N-acetylglucosaminyl deacetylase
MHETQERKSTLVVAPHGDDEALGAGALIAKCSSDGVPVHVLVMATDPSRHYGLDRETTLAERLEEIEASAQLLGFTFEVVFAGKNKLERLDTVPLRDLVDAIERTLDARQPDLVVVPHGDDYDQDHVACFRAAHAALRPMPPQTGKHLVSKVLSYEMPKLGWAVAPFKPNFYIAADAGLIERKCAAIAAYRTQLRADPHIRSLTNIRRLAALRGAEIGAEFAEAFHVWRWVS